MKKTRYKLILNGEVLGESSSIGGIAKLVGCTRAHIDQRITEKKTFTYKKITYVIIDKLDKYEDEDREEIFWGSSLSKTDDLAIDGYLNDKGEIFISIGDAYLDIANFQCIALDIHTATKFIKKITNEIRLTNNED